MELECTLSLSYSGSVPEDTPGCMSCSFSVGPHAIVWIVPGSAQTGCGKSLALGMQFLSGMQMLTSNSRWWESGDWGCDSPGAPEKERSRALAV